MAKTVKNSLPPKNPNQSDLFWGLLTVLPIACLVLVIIRYGVDIPYLDQWDFVPLLKKTFQGVFPLHDLWMLHNEHRLFFPQLIILALAHLSLWNIYYEMAVTVLFALGFFFVIVFLLRRSEKSGARVAGWVMPMVSLIVFSLSQWENWSWGGQLAIFLSIFTFSTAVTFLLSPVFRRRDFIIASLSGIVSTFSFANGLLVWPIGFFILFSKDKKKINPAIILWLLLAVITALVYFYGYAAPSAGSSAGNILSRPLEYAAYVLKFLGSPLSNSSGGVALAAGLFGPALFFCSVLALMRSRKMDFQVLLPYIAFGFYSIGSAAISGMGRAGFGSDYALASRYITFSSPLWISNAVFLGFFISGKPVQRTGKYISIAILPVIVFMLLSNLVQGELFFNARYVYLDTARQEILSQNNDDFLLLLHPSAAVVKEGLAGLKQYHLSVYREAAEPDRNISDESRVEKIKGRFNRGLLPNSYLDGVCARLGMLYLKQGRFKEGEFLWKKALEINPEFADIYRNLIIFYLYRGDIAQAGVYAGKMRDRGMPVDPEILKKVGK